MVRLSTSARGGFADKAPLQPYNLRPGSDLCFMRDNGSDGHSLTDDQFEDGTPTSVRRPRR
jgi:hypothetical protein